MLQLSLLKLALRTAGIVVALCLLALLISLAALKFSR